MKRFLMRMLSGITFLALAVGAAASGKAVAQYQAHLRRTKVNFTPYQTALKEEVTDALLIAGLRPRSEVDPRVNYTQVMDFTNVDRNRRVYFEKQDGRWVFGCLRPDGTVADMLADSDAHLRFLLHNCA